MAVVVAALGTGLVFLYVQGADNRAEERFETVDVLRAVAPIEPGETIDAAAAAGKLQLEAVSQSDLLPNAQSDTTALERPGRDHPDLPGRADHLRQVRRARSRRRCRR